MDKLGSEKPVIIDKKPLLPSWVNMEFFEVNKNLILAWLVAVLIFSVIYFLNAMSQQFLPGMTEAKEHIINFKESVIVEKVLVQSGQFVEKNAPLFQLRRPDLDLTGHENDVALREATVEMSLSKGTSIPMPEWYRILNLKKSNSEILTPLEMRFISLYGMKLFIDSEKERLNVLAPVSGHVGEIAFNLGESVPPFSSIVTIRQTQPSFVKSYIPETFDLTQLNENRSAVVRSMSRRHQGEGVIVSIGTMLTELPIRFQKDPTNIVYGREIKLSLPEGNGFYLGEKVSVTLEEK